MRKLERVLELLVRLLEAFGTVELRSRQFGCAGESDPKGRGEDVRYAEEPVRSALPGPAR